MSKRLQVLIDEKEYRLFQKTARTSGLNLGEWVRESLRKVVQSLSTTSPETKLRNLRRASHSQYPSGEINDILSQIETGYTT